MTNDEARVRQLLKAALPPAIAQGPSRDLWPLVVQRTQTPPRWTRADLSLAAALIVGVLMFPKWFWFLAYHL